MRIPTVVGILRMRGCRGVTDTGWRVRVDMRRERIDFSRPDGATVSASLWVDFRDGIASVDLDEVQVWELAGRQPPLEWSDRADLLSIADAALRPWGLGL